MSKIASLLRLFRHGFPTQRTDSPLMVLFPVTTRCDMKCRHCGDDVWGDPALDLTLEEIERATVSLGACADLAIGGGSRFCAATFRRSAGSLSRTAACATSASLPTASPTTA